MKKSLIALAALAAVSAASAQSAVTISGYIDRGYTSVDNTDLTKKLNTLSSSAGTSAIFFKGTEDIGGGTAVGFLLETDFADLDGNTQKSSYSAAQNAGFANGESFISLSNANLGTVKLGAVNSFTLSNATSVAAPSISTAIGSTFSSNFSIFNGIGTGVSTNGGVGILTTTSSSKGTTGARDIRIANTIQYVTPMFSGFSAGVSYAAQNNNVTATGGNGNTVGMTELALNYANGPVKAGFTSIKYSVGSNGTSQNTATTGSTFAAPLTLAGGLTSTHNLLAASYEVLPQLKLNVGFGSFSSNDSLSQGKSQQVGATYVIGNVDLMAQYATVNDTSINNTDRKMFGLGANYNLSKTTRAYFRYDDINYASNKAVYDGSKQTRTAVGISKAF